MTSKIVTGKPSLLKQMNRNIIIKLIFQYKEISRADIAKLTNLKLPSVMRLVDGLIDDGIVVDIGKGISTGGRRPNLIALKKDAMYIIGIEIAIDTSVVLTDMVGDVIDRWSSEDVNFKSPEEVLEQSLTKVNQLLLHHHIKKEQVAGIGIGTPGTNFKHKENVDYAILKGWDSIDVKTWFEDRTELPIFADNVARTRTLAELWFGHGHNHKDFIYVFVDQGVGCGIVKEGKIYEGHNGVAGEFGHNIVSINGKQCYCGSKGCLEMYVSAGSILQEVNELHPEIVNFSEVITNLSGKHHLYEAGKVLGIGVSNLINTYNPKAIILGGIVSKKSDIFIEGVYDSVYNNVFSRYAENTEILIGHNIPVGKGSVALVINQIFKSEI